MCLMPVDLDSLWDFDDPATSELRFREALAGASDEDARTLQTQLARALGLQGRYDEGHAVLDGITPVTPEDQVRCDLERGRLLRSSGRAAESVPSFETARDAAATAGLEALHIDALHMLAIAATSPTEQIAANQQALEAARSATEERARRWEASLLNNLGCALVDDGRPEEALAVFEEALVARRGRGQERETQIARWMVAWTLRLLGRTDEARSEQLALKAELEAAGIEDPYVDEELALLGGDEGQVLA